MRYTHWMEREKQNIKPLQTHHNEEHHHQRISAHPYSIFLTVGEPPDLLNRGHLKQGQTDIVLTPPPPQNSKKKPHIQQMDEGSPKGQANLSPVSPCPDKNRAKGGPQEGKRKKRGKKVKRKENAASNRQMKTTQGWVEGKKTRPSCQECDMAWGVPNKRQQWVQGEKKSKEEVMRSHPGCHHKTGVPWERLPTRLKNGKGDSRSSQKFVGKGGWSNGKNEKKGTKTANPGQPGHRWKGGQNSNSFRFGNVRKSGRT